MRIPRVLPDLPDERTWPLFSMRLKARRASDNVNGTAPIGLDEEQKTALAHVLTPIYLGEQTAMAGAGTSLPRMMLAEDTEARFYLGTRLLDGARHLETLTRLYRTLERRADELRDLTTMYRYHHRLLFARAPREWVWGVLISDVLAKRFCSTFVDQFPDTLLGTLTGRILIGKARYQALAQRYLARTMASLDRSQRRSLLAVARDLLSTCHELYGRLGRDMVKLGIDGASMLSRLERDIAREADWVGRGGSIFDGEEDGDQILYRWREEMERRTAVSA